MEKENPEIDHLFVEGENPWQLNFAIEILPKRFLSTALSNPEFVFITEYI